MHLNSKYDIIFLDPPYQFTFSAKSIEFIINVLAQDALLIFEYHNNISRNNPFLLTDKIKEIKKKKYGQTEISFLKYNGK